MKNGYQTKDEKVYIMTDLEGVAGVLDFDNRCSPDSRYYELAKEFLTLEVNSAVDGFLERGAEAEELGKTMVKLEVAG